LALGTGEGYVIDAMQMRHVVDGREITLYKRGLQNSLGVEQLQEIAEATDAKALQRLLW
jgi:hypothetical protein